KQNYSDNLLPDGEWWFFFLPIREIQISIIDTWKRVVEKKNLQKNLWNGEKIDGNGMREWCFPLNPWGIKFIAIRGYGSAFQYVCGFICVLSIWHVAELSLMRNLFQIWKILISSTSNLCDNLNHMIYNLHFAFIPNVVFLHVSLFFIDYGMTDEEDGG
ncbi:hypothetical protein ACJX0J_012648, partial [Zea mays]